MPAGSGRGPIRPVGMPSDSALPTAVPPRGIYRGRFAPSPTGPLHFGSLVAAVGSYLEAQKAGGRWLVRIDDLDPPREVPGAADVILRTLERLGFAWDETVLYQSTRAAAYEAALQRLRTMGRAYACSCSRSELESTGHPAPGEELRYPGFCRQQPRRAGGPHAYRFRVPPAAVGFRDALQGDISSDLEASIGDFVIKRRDGLFAYQLAVVVDDAAQGITHVVRGADLLLNTPRQIALQQALGLPIPAYMHLPVAVDAMGQKLSKSSGSTAVDGLPPQRALWQALVFFGLRPPAALMNARLEEIWRWALQHWPPRSLAGLRTIEVKA